MNFLPTFPVQPDYVNHLKKDCEGKTPIMANKMLLDGQLHSSGPKMIRFTKLDVVTFTQHLL